MGKVHKFVEFNGRMRIAACGIKSLGNAGGCFEGPFISAFVKPTCARCLAKRKPAARGKGRKNA